MGRRFIGHYGGKGVIYSCKKCDTYLTSHGELTSSDFMSTTGAAMLFYKVWNIEHGKIDTRRMMTGWHVVRDVMCIVCKSRLGWMYEMAAEPSQEYKERQVILECALISKRTPSFEDPLGEDEKGKRFPSQIPHLERPRRVRRRETQDSVSSNRSGSESNDSVSSLSTNTSV